MTVKRNIGVFPNVAVSQINLSIYTTFLPETSLITKTTTAMTKSR